MKKVRRFNGEDDSYVEGTASSKADDVNDQLRQDQTERAARLARGESADAPAALASRSMSRAAEPAAPAAPAEPAPENTRTFAAADRFSGPAAKPPIVTMDQVKKAGFSTLREYLNDQQGLKPRGTPPPSKSTAADTSEAYGKEQQYQRASEAAQTPEGKAKRAAMEKSQAVENVYPEQALLGGAGFGIKSIAKAAKDLANRGGAKEAAKRVEPTFREKELEIIKEVPRLLGGPKKQLALPAPPSKLALPAPPKRLPYDRPAASAAESTKAKLAGELRRGAQPTKFTSPRKSTASKKTRKFNEDEGGVEFRRGGSVSSASKRADGCAIRGKTRA